MSVVRCQWSVVSFFPVISKIWEWLNSICYLMDVTDYILSVMASEFQNSETTRNYQRTQNNFDAKTNILITGPPRCGKSTLIEKVVSRIERPVTGFFTREIKGKGRRVGFSINTLDGKEGILA